MLARHTLVWLRDEPLALRPEWQSAVGSWYASGLPFIVSRTRSGEALSVDFCQPRSTNGAEPLRICSTSSPDLVIREELPLKLSTVVDLFPVFRPLLELSRGLDVRVFGSFLWQSITQRTYTTPLSDFELLVRLPDISKVSDALTFLRRADVCSAYRIVGELSFPGLGEVNWREFLTGSDSLVVKSLDGVSLHQRNELQCATC